MRRKGGVFLQPRLNIYWLIMLILAAVFSILYLYFSIFPGSVNHELWKYFTEQQLWRERQYVTVLRLINSVNFFVTVSFLTWLLFSGKAAALSRWTEQFCGGYWRGVGLFFILLWLLLKILDFPFLFFGDYIWDHRWGVSTQSMAAWGVDFLKGSALNLLLLGVGVMLLMLAMNHWQRFWWLLGAIFISVWFFVQSFLWPVLISPLFNDFVPAKDPAIITMVDNLSKKAGVPVDQVLIMDASRRTTMANAYFAGLGTTKRIVLYDTLLTKYPQDEVEAVIAHEMAHWSLGHIMKGLLWNIAGNFLVWFLLYLVVHSTLPDLRRYPSSTLLMILLFSSLVMFLSNPVQNAISRQMEAEADRTSIIYTGNPAAAVRLQIDLAAKDLADLDPPSFIAWFSYSHPPVLERIKALQEKK